jgi:hypothetical protein
MTSANHVGDDNRCQCERQLLIARISTGPGGSLAAVTCESKKLMLLFWARYGVIIRMLPRRMDIAVTFLDGFGALDTNNRNFLIKLNS